MNNENATENNLQAWAEYVGPLCNICHEAQTERGIPAGVMALAMVAAGWQVAVEEMGPDVAAVALLTAIDELRKDFPHHVAQAEAAERKAGGLHS